MSTTTQGEAPRVDALKWLAEQASLSQKGPESLALVELMYRTVLAEMSRPATADQEGA